MKRKELYPGAEDVKKEKEAAIVRFLSESEELPDFIGGKPNYAKFRGWEPEDVLRYLNID